MTRLCGIVVRSFRRPFRRSEGAGIKNLIGLPIAPLFHFYHRCFDVMS